MNIEKRGSPNKKYLKQGKFNPTFQLDNTLNNVNSFNFNNNEINNTEDFDVRNQINDVGIFNMEFNARKDSNEFVYERLMKKHSFQVNLINSTSKEQNDSENEESETRITGSNLIPPSSKNNREILHSEETFINKLQDDHNTFFGQIFKKVKQEEKLFLDDDGLLYKTNNTSTGQMNIDNDSTINPTAKDCQDINSVDKSPSKNLK